MKRMQVALTKSKNEFVEPKADKIAKVEIGKCHKCTKTFADKDELSEHVTSEHSKIICDLCGKIFDQTLAMKKHFSDEHLTEKVLCEKCDKVFLTKDECKEHQFFVHEDVKCAKCDTTFTIPGLKEHVENRVSCQICNVELCNYDLLPNHKNKMHPRHSCDFCKKTFSERNLYKNHLLKYHQDQIFDIKLS